MTRRPSPGRSCSCRRASSFDAGTDFTVAVEEEFAILDPVTLELDNRFEELQAAARGHRARGAPRRRADRLRGRGAHRALRDVRRGRGRGSASGARQLAELAEPLGIALGARRHASVEPVAGPADHRHAALPAQRRAPPLRRLAQQHLRPPRARRDPRRRPRGRRHATALRAYLPELLALSASSPFVEGVFTYLHSARTQIFTRMFPRCGVPDAYDGWDGYEAYVRVLYETGSIDEHTQIWWSVRPHLAFPTVEIRICDAQPDARRGAVARGALLLARRPHRPRARRGRAGAAAAAPHDRGEPLARHPLRALRRADRPARR